MADLFLHKSTHPLPLEIDDFRGKVKVDFKKCISCGLCERGCPTDAIPLKDVDNFEKKKPIVNHSICIRCGECEYLCPVNAIKMKSKQGVRDG